jgi:hypothetical protein
MCYWLLPDSGIPIARTTIQAVTQDELNTTNMQEVLKNFDQKMEDKLKVLSTDDTDALTGFHLYREDVDEDIQDNDTIEPASLDTEDDIFDQLLLAQPLLEMVEGKVKAKIIGRKRDQDGNLVGTYNSNPILNTIVYLAEFPDGSISEYAANIIAESIYNQVNDDGYDNTLFDSIIGHEYKAPLTDVIENGSFVPKSTEGWKICLQWKDGSSSWHPMIDVKNSFPVQLAEYASYNQLQDKPGFSWWVKYSLRKRERIMSSIHTRYAKRTHKFGIQVPMTVAEALAIDKATNTTFWHDAIKKE